MGNPPLALDLHYLLTAYGSEDCEAEALLGFAIQFMHETPIIPRSQITLGLTSLPGSNLVSGLLATSGLADQFEMIKITPATLGREELAWLWTALEADYRPTFPFQVSVVLIEPQFATSNGLPVLSRNITAQAGPTPQLIEAVPPTGQVAADVQRQCVRGRLKVHVATIAVDLYPGPDSHRDAIDAASARQRRRRE